MYELYIYTMDHPVLTVSNFMGNSIGTKRVKIVSEYDQETPQSQTAGKPMAS